jgi:hypothetical protein
LEREVVALKRKNERLEKSMADLRKDYYDEHLGENFVGQELLVRKSNRRFLKN